jgi:hypothetical protein
MTKMKNSILIVIPLLLLLVAALSACENEYVLRIPQNQLQEKVNETFPAKKPFLALGYFSFTFENPRVTLKEGSDRIHIALDVTPTQGALLNPQHSASIEVSSGIRYDNKQGAFYLVSPTIEQIGTRAALPIKSRPGTNGILAQLLAEYYATHPVYVLDASQLKQSAAKITLKSVSVENAELVVRLGL